MVISNITPNWEAQNIKSSQKYKENLSGNKHIA